jgi:hypothetical protein
MTCNEAQKEMAAFTGGDITNGRQEALLKHLAECPECRKALKDFRNRPPGAEAPLQEESGKPALHPLSSVHPAVFGGILLLLAAGVVTAKYYSAPDRDPFGSGMVRFSEAERKSLSSAGQAGKDIPAAVTPETYRDEERAAAELVDPSSALTEGIECMKRNDGACALSRFKTAAASRKDPKVREEARYRLVEAYASLKRCSEASLHTAALEREFGQGDLLGEAFLRNAECHASVGNAGDARKAYLNTIARFPALSDRAAAGMKSLADLQTPRDP